MSYAAAVGLAAAFTITAAQAADISGAGATFPYPIYAKWADAYKKETGIGLNYQSIGSGGGIKQIKAATVTFGATCTAHWRRSQFLRACPVSDGHGRHRSRDQR
jgi:phosphate transport system substrate-binding protein